MAADLHTSLVVWINDAERAAVGQLYTVLPEASVREGWHRAYCQAHHDCDWTTTGLEIPCDDAAWAHVHETHRSGPQAVEAPQALAALRAAVSRHAPVSCLDLYPCSLRHGHIICRVCGGEQPCVETRAIADQLGITTIEGEPCRPPLTSCPTSPPSRWPNSSNW